MSMRLTFTTIAILVLATMLATRSGLRPNPVGSGYTSGSQVGAQVDVSEESVRFECIPAGTDLLRRAAPAINGTARSPWAQRSAGLAGQLVCVNP